MRNLDARPPADTAEMRMIAAMRLVLASSALLIIYIDPAEPSRHVALTYSTLALYTFYSAIIYGLILLRARIMSALRLWSHWIDIAWYVVLIALSSGTNSIFFMFFFFSIATASFRWGFRLGLWTAIISSVSFTAVGYITAPVGPEFELNQFLLRPIYLLVLGYMIAYRGGYEITLQRRLALLKEINILSNPRLGIDRTIGANMERLRAFYNADACIGIFWNSGERGLRLRRVGRKDPQEACVSAPVPRTFARQLLSPARNHAILYASRRSWIPLDSCYEYDVVNREHQAESRRLVRALAQSLDTRCFLTVPIYYRGRLNGRLYLTSPRRAFRHSDVDFLLQAIEQVLPMLENVQLVDRLASKAAEEERRKIARDIHDSIIQPYIGLQIGLTSVQQKLEACDEPSLTLAEKGEMLPILTARIRRLVELTETGIAELRGFVSTLRGDGGQDGNLIGAVQRFASTFSEATGIECRIEVEGTPPASDRLSAEVFQMVAEGLSNIRRHTQSAKATVRLTCSSDKLLLRIQNDSDSAAKQHFMPRSIMERAESLSGRIHLEHLEDGGTAVVVEIPL